MKFKDALLAAKLLNASVLLPVKMGFFIKVRVAQDVYAAPSIPADLVEKYDLGAVAENYECNIFEIDMTTNKQIAAIQDRWIQWSVKESDIHRDSFMLL